MTWQVHFYNERSRVLARYGVQAPTPAEALVQARSALRAEHPLAVSRRPRSLLEQAGYEATSEAGDADRA